MVLQELAGSSGSSGSSGTSGTRVHQELVELQVHQVQVRFN